MRGIIGLLLMLAVLASLGACKNPSVTGGGGSNGGVGATFHTGIPF